MSDPRLDEIQAIPAEAIEAAARIMTPTAWGPHVWHFIAHGEAPTEARNRVQRQSLEDARKALEAAHPVLLAELRKAHEALARVEALAEAWRYKGEFGLGAWQEGYGPDPEGYVLDICAWELRAAVAAAKGDGE